MPQPQQHQIQTVSETYTTAHSNTGSPTHWVRPRIEPTSSRILVRFVNLWAMTVTPCNMYFKIFFILFLLDYSWFTVLCQFLLNSIMTQSYIYRHSFSHIISHHVLSQVFVYSSLYYTIGPHFLSFFLLLLLFFRATPAAHEISHTRGSNGNYRCWPMPQPQQHEIRGVSVSYTAARSNAWSLTHWVRPGLEPTSSWLPVRFISVEPQWELQYLIFFNGSCSMCIYT